MEAFTEPSVFDRAIFDPPSSILDGLKWISVVSGLIMSPPLDVICLGELLIDFVPTPSLSPLSRTRLFRLAPGGAPANVAVASRRLGMSCGFIGKVGDDPFGRYLRDVLKQEGLNLGLFTLSSEALTRLAFVTNDSNERQRFLFYGNPGADVLVRPDEVQENYFRGARIFHFGSISLIQEPSRSATLTALDYAHKHGLIVSFDPNLRPALWPSLRQARQEILRTLSHCHILKMNQSEWEFLFPGRKFEDSLSMLERKGISLSAVTLGAQGSIIGSHNQWTRMNGPQVKVVDTTGAGDGFMAGLLYQSLKRNRAPLRFEKAELTEMARFANVVGALTTTKAGCIPAFPWLRQVKKYL